MFSILFVSSPGKGVSGPRFFLRGGGYPSRWSQVLSGEKEGTPSPLTGPDQSPVPRPGEKRSTPSPSQNRGTPIPSLHYSTPWPGQGYPTPRPPGQDRRYPLPFSKGKSECCYVMGSKVSCIHAGGLSCSFFRFLISKDEMYKSKMENKYSYPTEDLDLDHTRNKFL